MSRAIGPKTLRGLSLIASGIPLRVAASMVGVADSTLVRARRGQPALQKGRPKLIYRRS
jgi:hypothetical protein